MQIKGLPRGLYRLYRYASTTLVQEEQIKERKKIIGDWEVLKQKRLADDEIA